MSQTTIQVSKETRERLKKLGRKGQTYDEVIQNLIEISRKAMFFNELDRITDTEEFVPLDEK
jgi:predicted CopG family antitoxin